MSFGPGDTEFQPVCVVIDTNVWRSQLMLKTPTGASLVYHLGRCKGFIGLPEIIEGELAKQVVEHGLDHAEKLRTEHRIISTMCGPSHLDTPTQEDLVKLVGERLQELDPVLARIPLTLEHVRAALLMVNADVPPNARGKQQFKDSAIWQAILTLATDYIVSFVTQDLGFFAGRDASNGLADNLQSDCDRIGVKIAVFNDLAKCLRSLQDDVPVSNQARLESLILPLAMEAMEKEATRNNLKIANHVDSHFDLFRTADTDKMAVDFKITMQIEATPQVINAEYFYRRAIAFGSCYYDARADAIHDLIVEEVGIVMRSLSGGRWFSLKSFGEDEHTPFSRRIDWE